MRHRKAIVRCGKKVSFEARWYKDEAGVERFVPGIARYLTDQQGVDLNKLCLAFNYNTFSLEEYMRFYASLGYSLSGFYEIFEKAEITKIGR